MTETFTFIELFCGVGGFRVGLEALGGRCVWACEIDRKAAETYTANFGQTPYHDVRTARPGKGLPRRFDLLTAGFPCQDFSGLGAQQGLRGKKGALFYEVVRLLRETRPPMFLGENVRGLLTLEGGAVMRTVVAEIEQLGYHVRFGEINSLCVVPQYRARVYIVAFLDETKAEAFGDIPASPIRLNPARTLASCLQSLREEPFLNHYRLSARTWHAVKQSKTTRKYGVESRLVRPESLETDTLIRSYRTSKLSLSQFVLDVCEQTPGVVRRPRWLTPREAARLMGFPESFLLPPGLTAYEQLGNAVTPAVIALVAGKMFGDEMRGLRACVKLTLAAMEKEKGRMFAQSGRVVSPVWSGPVRELVAEEGGGSGGGGGGGSDRNGDDGMFRWATVATGAATVAACVVFAAIYGADRQSRESGMSSRTGRK